MYRSFEIVALESNCEYRLLDTGKIYSSYVLTNIGFAVENKKDFFADLYVFEKYKLRFIYVLGGNNMDFTRLKNYMDRLVSEYNVPGVDCIVYKEHEQVFRYFNGKSDIENNKPMQGNELYIIFSMTKMLTCTCALQLFE